MILDLFAHPITFLPMLGILLLPWNAFLRLLAWLGLIVFGVVISLPAPHWSHGWGAALFIGILIWVAMIWAVTAVARCVLQLTFAPNKMAFHPLKGDFLLIGVVSLFAAAFVFMTAKIAFSGTETALLAHLILLILAACLWRFPWCAIGLAGLAGLSLFFPGTVHQAARQVAGADGYCIYLMQRNAFARDWRDLTFLTMDRGDMSPHAGLIIMTDPPTYASWSYRQAKFITPWSIYHPPPTLTCPTD